MNSLPRPFRIRYVDGWSSFYLVDNLQRVQGVVASAMWNQVSEVERASHAHVRSLLASEGVRQWAAFIGRNRDVNIVFPDESFFRWRQAHWHLIDKPVLRQILHRFGVVSEECDALVETVLGLSGLRLGGAILVPSVDQVVPRSVSSIDQSHLGGALVEMVRGRQFSDLVRDGSALGLISSDGLTVVSKSGVVLNSGQIIALHSGGDDSIGGGRTQAARSASFFGLSIKISEDGPITFYREGKRLIRFAT